MQKNTRNYPSTATLVVYTTLALSISTDAIADYNELGEAISSSNFNNNYTFNLESNPSSDKTIYLDFGYHPTTTTDYGSNNLTANYILSDGNASVSAQEHENIQKIWRIVAEDFLPFNVNVTTKATPTDDLKFTGGNDPRWGNRVNFTSESEETYSDGPFKADRDLLDRTVISTQFTANLPAYLGNATSHELGHSLGLSHDGDAAVPSGISRVYWGGHNIGPTTQKYYSIMGASSTNANDLVHWSRGEYEDYFLTDLGGPTAAQPIDDDLRVITDDSVGGPTYANGTPYRTDDHGNAFWNSTTLTAGVKEHGVIQRAVDKDYFYIQLSDPTTITIDINTAEYGANLNVKAVLFNLSGTEYTYDPSNNLGASFTESLPAGNWFVSVDGVGQGDPATNGYSDYGSLGYYNIVYSTISTATVPEPTSLSLLTLGGVLALCRRRSN